MVGVLLCLGCPQLQDMLPYGKGKVCGEVGLPECFWHVWCCNVPGFFHYWEWGGALEFLVPQYLEEQDLRPHCHYSSLTYDCGCSYGWDAGIVCTISLATTRFFQAVSSAALVRGSRIAGTPFAILLIPPFLCVPVQPSLDA